MNKKISIMPTPKIIEFTSDDSFVITSQVEFNHTLNCESCYTELCSIIHKHLDIVINMAECNSNKKGTIDLIIDKCGNIPDEGYVLDINRDSICIKGSTVNGVFYGVKSLEQIIYECGAVLPSIHIEDEPRFGYRAFMLDVGRYYYGVQDIKNFIDIMAVLKLNYFHWHLTEDQGWRIEIKKYPKLTEIGSKRTHTNFNRVPHSGFYTQEDIKEVVEYAHRKFIKVIPEIDIPGHMQAAIACYPELGCFDRKLSVATHWGVKHDILCAGKPQTMQFIKDVLSEVIELFTDGYIHLGGDEAVKTLWKICPHCTARIVELGLNNANELQAHMINEIAQFLKQANYKAIIWNEFEASEMCSKDIIWQYYTASTSKNDTDSKIAFEANNGRKIINGSSKAYYLDLPYNQIPLKTAYEYEPIVNGVKKFENIIGVEGALWTEYVPNINKALRMAYPRLYAVAESGWTLKENKNYSEFLTKLPIMNRYINAIYPNIKLRGEKNSNPNVLKGFFEQKWFGRRIFHWQGVHNLIDNARVARLAKRNK